MNDEFEDDFEDEFEEDVPQRGKYIPMRRTRPRYDDTKNEGRRKEKQNKPQHIDRKRNYE